MQEGWANFHQRRFRNWAAAAGNSTCFLHLHQNRASQRRCGHPMLFSEGRICQVRVWMREWSHRKQLALPWCFCTKLSSILALDNGQLFQSTVVSVCSWKENPGSHFFPCSRGLQVLVLQNIYWTSFDKVSTLFSDHCRNLIIVSSQRPLCYKLLTPDIQLRFLFCEGQSLI